VDNYLKNTLAQQHEYFRNPPPENHPSGYRDSERTKSRTEYIVGAIERHVSDRDSKILEIGCNVGRNLNGLFNAGYKRLFGIEINPEAVKLSKEYYPEMNSAAHIVNETIENTVGYISENEFDLIFTLAALVHIHTDSDWIFKEIVFGTKNIIVLEQEIGGRSDRHFLRNYEDVFCSLGMIQKYADAETPPQLSDALRGYVLRVFSKC